MEVAGQFRQLCHYQQLSLSVINLNDWFEFFWFLIVLLLYQSQPYLDYLSSILKIFAYQTIFREDFDKSLLSLYTKPDVKEEIG